MREAFDLQGTPAWDPLWDLLREDVIEMWGGKCGYAHWSECFDNSSHEEAMKVIPRLDEIAGIAD